MCSPNLFFILGEVAPIYNMLHLVHENNAGRRASEGGFSWKVFLPLVIEVVEGCTRRVMGSFHED